jgi:hypothetical protein
MSFTAIQAAVFTLLPPMPVRIGPQHLLIAVGLIGLVVSEWRMWRGKR